MVPVRALQILPFVLRYSCAENLRLEGYTGEIVMLSKEPGAPIDRTRLSKALGKAGELRSMDYMTKDLSISMFNDMEVTGVDSEAKTVTYKPVSKDRSTQSSTLKYDKLLLATGGKPRQLFVPGAKLKNVFTVRNQADNDALMASVQKLHKVVVVGGGFIGMELATMLTAKGCKVTILEMTDLPLERVFGKKIGAAIAKWLHKNKVRIEPENQMNLENYLTEVTIFTPTLPAISFLSGRLHGWHRRHLPPR